MTEFDVLSQHTGRIVLLRCFLRQEDKLQPYAVQTTIEELIPAQPPGIKFFHGYGRLLDSNSHADDILKHGYVNGVAEIRGDDREVLYSHPNLIKEWDKSFNPRSERDPRQTVETLILYKVLPDGFEW